MRKESTGVKPYPITIALAVVLHTIWAIGLTVDPTSVHVTALHAISLVSPEPAVASGIFATAAVFALAGLIASGRWLRLLLILPQQVVLWFSISGAVGAMALGQFADGIQRTHWFLIVDQIPIVLLALGHTVALLLVAGEHDA